MHTRLVLLFLLLNIPSLSYAIDFTLTEDGKLRFSKDVTVRDRLNIEMFDGNQWKRIQNRKIKGLNRLNIAWLQSTHPARHQEPRQRSLHIVYTDHPEPYYAVRHEYFIMLETYDGRYRIYKTHTNKLQFDVFNPESGRFEKFKEIDARQNWSAIGFIFKEDGDLGVTLANEHGPLLPIPLLSAEEIQVFKEREILARVRRFWPIVSVLNAAAQSQDAVFNLLPDVLKKGIPQLIFDLDTEERPPQRSL